jgi:cell division protein FtsB
MKIIAAVLFALLVLLQYRIWVHDGGMREVWQLRAEVAVQKEENEKLASRNRTLVAEVQDLKKGKVAVEERARTDLGMIGSRETFFQVVQPEAAKAALTTAPQ